MWLELDSWRRRQWSGAPQLTTSNWHIKNWRGIIIIIQSDTKTKLQLCSQTASKQVKKMEIFYLLGSIFSTCFTSLAFTLLLPFRLILARHRRPPPPSLSTAQDEAVSLYEGTVWHDRRRPVRHSFNYSIRYALFDLDHAPRVPPDHLSSNEARRMAKTTGPVLVAEFKLLFFSFLAEENIYIWWNEVKYCDSYLLTIPPSVGYEQNPLSLYYCYDLEGSIKVLKKCIAEVCIFYVKL